MTGVTLRAIPEKTAGFTLIELMVVLLILAILLAIAIPTFLGVTKSANDRAAQSNLNTALVNAKAYYQNQSQTYNTTAAAVAALSSAEPSLTFQSTASTSQNQISVFVPSATAGTSGTGIILAAVSKNGSNCWYAVDNTVQQTVTDVPYVEPPRLHPRRQRSWHLLRGAEECRQLHCVDHRGLGPAGRRLPGQRIPSDAVA